MNRLRFLDIGADLIFDYDISEVICKIARDGHVPFVLRVIGGSGAIR